MTKPVPHYMKQTKCVKTRYDDLEPGEVVKSAFNPCSFATLKDCMSTNLKKISQHRHRRMHNVIHEKTNAFHFNARVKRDELEYTSTDYHHHTKAIREDRKQHVEKRKKISTRDWCSSGQNYKTKQDEVFYSTSKKFDKSFDKSLFASIYTMPNPSKTEKRFNKSQLNKLLNVDPLQNIVFRTGKGCGLNNDGKYSKKMLPEIITVLQKVGARLGRFYSRGSCHGSRFD